nr:hypothetical transcript [Hymenolepis microstoma]
MRVKCFGKRIYLEPIHRQDVSTSINPQRKGALRRKTFAKFLKPLFWSKLVGAIGFGIAFMRWRPNSVLEATGMKKIALFS